MATPVSPLRASQATLVKVAPVHSILLPYFALLMALDLAPANLFVSLLSVSFLPAHGVLWPQRPYLSYNRRQTVHSEHREGDSQLLTRNLVLPSQDG